MSKHRKPRSMTHTLVRRLPELGLLTLAFAGAYLAGYTAAPAEGPAEGTGAVNVSITYDENGEAERVTLTDGEGLDMPTGSVAESWPETGEVDE